MDLRKINHGFVIDDTDGNYFAARINRGWDQKSSSHLSLFQYKYVMYYLLKSLSNKNQVVITDKNHHYNGCFPVNSDDSFQ